MLWVTGVLPGQRLADLWTSGRKLLHDGDAEVDSGWRRVVVHISSILCPQAHPHCGSTRSWAAGTDSAWTRRQQRPGIATSAVTMGGEAGPGIVLEVPS